MTVSYFSAAFDTIIARKSWGAHDFYADVEARSDGTHALIVRSNDKTIIGRTNTPGDAELLFNDSTGAFVPFVVATSDDASALASAAAQLIAFYSAEAATFSARVDAMGQVARDVLPGILAVWGSRQRVKTPAGGKTGWKVGSLHDANRAASAKQSAAIAEAAKCLNNADALAAALQTVSGNAGTPLSPELLAMVQQVWSMVGAAAAPVAPPVAQQVAPPTMPVAKPEGEQDETPGRYVESFVAA
jgi:hypothetical protein